MRSLILGAPHLNFKRYKEIPLRHQLGLAGYFTVELVHAKTQLVTKQLKFKNLITNVGMDGLATKRFWYGSGVVFNTIAVGTGTTPPAFTDVALVSELARTATAYGSPADAGDTSWGYTSYSYTRVFSQAQANGNLTEVGIFDSTTAGAGNMLCRQLLLDELGSPTAITKTSDYELRVTYELRVYWEPDTVYSATVNGVAQNVTRRIGDWGSWVGPAQGGHGMFQFSGGGNMGAIAYSGTLPAIGIVPSGQLAALPNFGWSHAAYVAGSYSRDSTFTWTPASFSGTVKTFGLCCRADAHNITDKGYAYNHELTNAVTKSNLEQLVVNHTHSWARV